MNSIKTFFVAAALTLPSVASAGKLAEGIFGIPWGEKTEFPAPFEDCVKDTSSITPWECQREIDGIKFEVAFVWEMNLFYGAAIRSKDGYESCSRLQDMLEAAWGKSFPTSRYLTGKMDNRAWNDGRVSATWKYNTVTHHCDVFVFHLDMLDTIKAEKKKKAAEAASKF
jgi:hypothetical protein